MPESSAPAPADVLLLIADTGGGHRAAARAVAASLRHAYPGRFRPVLLDPLAGPGSAWLLRWLTRLYGPVVRRAPWLWGAAYRLTDSRPAMRLLEGTVLRLADRPVRAAVTAHRPVAVVSFHPLTAGAAARAAHSGGPRPPAVTVVTDLAGVHTSWLHAGADWLVLPPGAPRGHPPAGPRWLELGVPVAADFAGGPVTAGQRAALRRRLGVAGAGFLAVLSGGGEGAGGLLRTARALTGSGISVAIICGRNERARRRLSRLAGRADGRLTVLGFVGNMPDWLRCADVLVTKAGPGTIAEAACCGAPMLITSHLPGQEAGNVDLVVSAGAGRHVPRTGQLLREIARLRGDPAALAVMRAASARLARPGAAAGAAALIARLARHPEPTQTPLAQTPEPVRTPPLARAAAPASAPVPAVTPTLAGAVALASASVPAMAPVPTGAAAPAGAADAGRAAWAVSIAQDPARAAEPARTARPAVGAA
ncbi:MAG: MGDG synthase family glycosyltransferase [Gemmatimonadota bacterium]